jgi:hypothetical protein
LGIVSRKYEIVKLVPHGVTTHHVSIILTEEHRSGNGIWRWKSALLRTIGAVSFAALAMKFGFIPPARPEQPLNKHVRIFGIAIKVR